MDRILSVVVLGVLMAPGAWGQAPGTDCAKLSDPYSTNDYIAGQGQIAKN